MAWVDLEKQKIKNDAIYPRMQDILDQQKGVGELAKTARLVRELIEVNRELMENQANLEASVGNLNTVIEALQAAGKKPKPNVLG